MTVDQVVDSPAVADIKKPTGWSRVRWTWVVLSSIAVAAIFVGQYADGSSLATLAKSSTGLAPVYAARPVWVQVAFYFHISFSGLALLLGPFQFVQLIRNKVPRIHRMIGRVYLISVGLGGLGAFIMSMFSSVGIAGFIGFGSLAVWWEISAFKAYRAIRNRDFRNHQGWMIRNFALTYAAVSLRLFLGLFIVLQAVFVHAGAFNFGAAYENAYAPLPFLAWIPSVFVAEYLVRRRGLPALRMTSGDQPVSSGS
jgi:uncharacterized membrane protein